MDEPENHIHNFDFPMGNVEYDITGKEYQIMACQCGETELQTTGRNYYDEDELIVEDASQIAPAIAKKYDAEVVLSRRAKRQLKKLLAKEDQNQ